MQGHHLAEIWEYTPRQCAAFLFLGRRRQGRERAVMLTIAQVAAHGSPDNVKKLLRELERAR